MATNSPLTTSVVVNLTGNMTQRAAEFGRAISRMDTQASQSLAHLRQSIHTTSADLDNMGNMALVGGTASMTAAGYAFNQTFLTQARNMERYRTQMKANFGTNADDMMAWAQENAKSTTFALNDVIESMNMLKGFGLDPTQILPSFEDAAASKGWTPDRAKELMRQVGQMWSKNKMQLEEVSIFQEEGVNPMEILSKATGRDVESLYKAMEKGELKRDALMLFLREMKRHYEGQSVEAMKGLNGAISNLGDTWDQFQVKVMDAGVSDAITQQIRDLLQWYEAAEQSGELDSIVQNAADLLKTVIEEGPKAAQSILEVGEAINTVAQALGGWETLAKGMAAIYAANKLARLGSGAVSAGKTAHGVGRAGWQGGRNAYDYLRGRRTETDKPGVEIPGLDDVQRVFVVNWPHDLDGGGRTGDGKNSNKNKKGKGGGKPSLPTISQPAPVRAPAPTTSPRPVSSAPDMPTKPKVKPLTHLVGPTSALASAAEKGVPVINGILSVAEFAMADNNAERGEAVGGGMGAVIGGAIGTAILPGIGTVLGSVLGDFLGSLAGREVGEQLDEPATSQQKGEIKVTLDVPEHVKVKSVQTTSPDYEMAFYRGLPWGGF